jgi:hypothetical protein
MRTIALFLFLLLFTVTAFSQKAGWDKLQTDDGELTLTMPAGCYSNFYNRDGISVYDRDSRDKFRLTEMRIISCYHDGAMLNVEIYQSARAKAAAKAMQKTLKIDGDELNVGKDFYAVGQVTINENYVLEQRLAASDKRVYLITAASRQSSNETMQTFLDSVQLADEDAAVKTDGNSVLISKLENRVPKVYKENELTAVPNSKPKAEEPPRKKFIALKIAKPSYTEAARKYNTNGKIRLRLLFGESSVTGLEVVRDLPNGLLREVIIAALRMKFLPEERDGKPVSTMSFIEYHFSVY